VHNSFAKPDAVIAIAEGLDLVLLSDDELLVQFGTRSRPSELFRDADLTGLLRRTIGRLPDEGPILLTELISSVPEDQRSDAVALMNELLDRGIVTDLDCSPVEQYLNYTLTGTSALARQSVSIIGAGPIGARIAHSLLQHGVGRVVLLDDRKADQLSSSFMPLGLTPSKAQNGYASYAVRDWLSGARCSGAVECLEAGMDSVGVEASVEKSELTVLALEGPDLRLAHLVNRFCVRERKPWMLASIDGNFGLVGPLFVPIHTACYNDYRALAFAATPSVTMARKHRQHLLSRQRGSFFPGLPSYAEIVAGHSTVAAVHFLLRDTCFAVGRVLVIDFDTMTIDIENVLKLPRCPVCGAEKSSYRPVFGDALISPDPK
jgi:bacteriocin biosynthesis cyclodehydratase domain-containing protein